LPLSEAYLQKLQDEERANGYEPATNESNPTLEAAPQPQREDIEQPSVEETQKETESTHNIQDHRATFTDTPIRPVEKRKVPLFQPR
jgi:hypothetical protein